MVTTGGALAKGSRITGDQRSTLAAEFGQRYAEGDSIRAIAEESGRSFGFVHGLLKESGVDLRGRGGATRGPRAAPTASATEKAAATVQKAAKVTAKTSPAEKKTATKKTATTKTAAKKTPAKKAAQQS